MSKEIDAYVAQMNDAKDAGDSEGARRFEKLARAAGYTPEKPSKARSEASAPPGSPRTPVGRQAPPKSKT